MSASFWSIKQDERDTWDGHEQLTIASTADEWHRATTNVYFHANQRGWIQAEKTNRSILMPLSHQREWLSSSAALELKWLAKRRKHSWIVHFIERNFLFKFRRWSSNTSRWSSLRWSIFDVISAELAHTLHSSITFMDEILSMELKHLCKESTATLVLSLYLDANLVRFDLDFTSVEYLSLSDAISFTYGTAAHQFTVVKTGTVALELDVSHSSCWSFRDSNESQRLPIEFAHVFTGGWSTRDLHVGSESMFDRSGSNAWVFCWEDVSSRINADVCSLHRTVQPIDLALHTRSETRRGSACELSRVQWLVGELAVRSLVATKSWSLTNTTVGIPLWNPVVHQCGLSFSIITGCVSLRSINQFDHEGRVDSSTEIFQSVLQDLRSFPFDLLVLRSNLVG